MTLSPRRRRRGTARRRRSRRVEEELGRSWGVGRGGAAAAGRPRRPYFRTACTSSPRDLRAPRRRGVSSSARGPSSETGTVHTEEVKWHASPASVFLNPLTTCLSPRRDTRANSNAREKAWLLPAPSEMRKREGRAERSLRTDSGHPPSSYLLHTLIEEPKRLIRPLISPHPPTATPPHETRQHEL